MTAKEAMFKLVMRLAWALKDEYLQDETIHECLTTLQAFIDEKEKNDL